MEMELKILKWRLYHFWMSLKVSRIRRKDRIRFLFILSELTQWKTEPLYLAMRNHPRFEPVLGITPSRGFPGAEKNVVKYCEEKGYPFILLDPEKTIVSQIDVDFVTHQKPYLKEIQPAHTVRNNRSVPVVVIQYYLSTIIEEWVVNQRISCLAWRQFIDNDSCAEAWKPIHRLHGLNYAVTGLPVMDELMTPKEQLEDVWPVHDGRKRIIYAPHHTIADMHWKGIAYSTFLENGAFMLEMRDKYKDQVYFVFRPHPALRSRLLRYWGEEKTDAYYRAWEQEGASHVETGKYLALFNYSDAMIHDCASYTVEYMYTGNPVMYLTKDDSHAENMIPYARKAFDLHYHGKSHEDIERFILDVIRGEDPLKEERTAFRASCLYPPNGKTACENIMNEILGEK